MAAFAPLTANSFGGLHFSDNTNVKLAGENSTGSVRSNSNLLIAATNCLLNLSNNSNITVNAEQCFMDLKSSSNVTLAGKGNTVKIEGCSNVELEGIGNYVTLVSSSNLQLFVNATTLDLGGNTNAKIRMNGGQVVAKDNVNLKISGEEDEGGSLNVKGTKNHTFKGLSRESIAGGVKQNEVEMIAGSSRTRQVGPGTWFSSLFSGWTNWGGGGDNVTYSLTYIDNVQVDGKNYKLDDFNFTIDEKSGAKFEVILDGRNVDPGSLGVQVVAPNQCLVTATKLGEKLACKFTGPAIIPGGGGGDHAFTMDMTGGGDSD